MSDTENAYSLQLYSKNTEKRITKKQTYKQHCDSRVF